MPLMPLREFLLSYGKLPRKICMRPPNHQHGAGVKFRKKNGKKCMSHRDTFTISISDTPELMSGESDLTKKEFEIVVAWIKDKKDELLYIWENFENIDRKKIEEDLKPGRKEKDQKDEEDLKPKSS